MSSALLNACTESDSITLETHREILAVEDLGNGARVSCADGLKSVVRKCVIDDGEPVCAEFVAYRGAIPMEEVIETAGMDTIRYWIGPELHLMQCPLRRGELYNQVAVFKSYC
jgi:3-hydroxybenzoate 6-monooxygenase